jgi:phosphoribosylformylglycinamidine synthase
VKIAVVVFPGSNADFDALHVARDVLRADARYVFHKETSLGDADAVILPGGFAHGDYLRCGAIARFSPIAADVGRFADRGGPVLGICNGFQVLTEMHLLPGALTRNAHLKFECGDVFVRSEGSGPWLASVPTGTVLRLPIAHAEGRWQADAATLAKLEANGQIALRYCTSAGDVASHTPRNGSLANIAGITNEKKNVLGLMPHPERASEDVLGNADGFKLFASLRDFLAKGARA